LGLLSKETLSMPLRQRTACILTRERLVLSENISLFRRYNRIYLCVFFSVDMVSHGLLCLLVTIDVNLANNNGID
jgi:hypothetical protein